MSQPLAPTSCHRTWQGRVLREVNALATRRSPEAASWRRVKQAILEAGTHLRLEAGQTSPPIQLDGIRELRHIYNETSFDSPSGPDAVLVPASRGFTLRLQAGHSKFRRRFSTAHEIGHTFFYDIEKNPPVRLISHSPLGILSPKEEDICSAFARELLLPRDLVDPDSLNLSGDNGLEVVLDLAKDYEVSAEVVIRRLMSDWSKLETTIAIFQEARSLGKNGNVIHTRWLKGKVLKSYLRKKEKAAFEETLTTIRNGPPYQPLDRLAALYSDIASIQWYAPKTAARLVVLLNFKR